MKKKEKIKITIQPNEEVICETRIGNVFAITINQIIPEGINTYQKITNGGAYADVFFDRNSVYVSWIMAMIERKGYGRHLIEQIEKMAKGRKVKFPTVVSGFLEVWLKYRGYKRIKEYSEAFKSPVEILAKTN